MKRRNFLKIPALGGLAFMMRGIPIRAYAQSPLLQAVAKQTAANGRILVLVQLNGGNDGINTIVPLDQYSALSSLRSNVLVSENKILSLTGVQGTGMHPAMAALRDMYNDGLVNIVQAAGYPSPNFSHFRSTDIWTTGSDANQYLNTGWLGRYLDTEYANYPTGYPNADTPDPLAIQIGTGISNVLQGPAINMGYAISNVNSFYNLINNSVGNAPNTAAGHELTFIRNIAQQTHSYTSVIQNATQSATNLASYPVNNSLADQLKIVAQLIAGGLQTSVYVVSLGGFDTHANQAEGTYKESGPHAALLKMLSEAISAFYKDLKLMHQDDRVTTMTYSEFGRRIVSNQSGGTDHGAAAPVMVFGPNVNPRIIGHNPIISPTSTVNDNIPMQFDYRSIYASVLTDWFGVTPAVVSSVLMNDYPILPIFYNNTATAVEETAAAVTADEMLGQNFPNPFSRTTTIRFNTKGGATSLQIFDISGRLVKTVLQQDYSAGRHEVTIDRAGLSSGNYMYRLTTGSEQATKKMLVID